MTYLKRILFSWTVAFLLLLVFGGCEKDVVGQSQKPATLPPQLYMDFESGMEPFQLPDDRPVDMLDGGNGCLPASLWNPYYVYAVCISPTVDMSYFSITRSSSVARKGDYSLYFYLKPTPLDKWPLGEATHRAELGPNRKSPFPRYPIEGEERWYGFSLFFPKDFVFAPAPVQNDLRFMVAQWQHGSEGSPIFAFEVHGDQLALSRSKGLSIDSDWIPPQMLTKIERGKWIDLVIKTVWSKADGEIIVWINDDKKYQKSDIPTIYSDLDNGGGLKIGLYYWRWKYRESVQSSLNAGIIDREIYIDEVREFLGSDGYEVVTPRQ